MNTLINTALNPTITSLRRSGLLAEDLDYHIVRASMVIMFFFFGYQKWWAYEAVKLLRTLALVSRHCPASQRLIGGAIGIGYTFSAASTTASAFGSLLDAVVSICPYAATATIADILLCR
jgi:hypothetical protein